MKKIALIAATSALLFSGSAMAEDSTGCGVGSMIFDGKSGVGPQVLAVTTNGSTGNQTFGISSGTLGCDQNGTISSSEKIGMFTGENMERLAMDMSRGEGEALATVADMLEVRSEDRADFYAAAKANFDRIYTSSDVTAGEVVANLNAVLAADDKLKIYTT